MTSDQYTNIMDKYSDWLLDGWLEFNF